MKSYWESELIRGTETVPFDQLDPVRQMEVRQHIFVVAPHIIRILKESMFRRVPVTVPDVIPEYFFEDEG